MGKSDADKTQDTGTSLPPLPGVEKQAIYPCLCS